jgi:hypothetical protein
LGNKSSRPKQKKRSEQDQSSAARSSKDREPSWIARQEGYDKDGIPHRSEFGKKDIPKWDPNKQEFQSGEIPKYPDGTNVPVPPQAPGRSQTPAPNRNAPSVEPSLTIPSIPGTASQSQYQAQGNASNRGSHSKGGGSKGSRVRKERPKKVRDGAHSGTPPGLTQSGPYYELMRGLNWTWTEYKYEETPGLDLEYQYHANDRLPGPRTIQDKMQLTNCEGLQMYHLRHKIVSGVCGYFNGIPETMSEDEALDMFAKYGEITGWTFIRDRDSMKPDGTGYVQFETADAYDQAMEGFDDKPLEGHHWHPWLHRSTLEFSWDPSDAHYMDEKRETYRVSPTARREIIHYKTEASGRPWKSKPPSRKNDQFYHTYGPEAARGSRDFDNRYCDGNYPNTWDRNVRH